MAAPTPTPAQLRDLRAALGMTQKELGLALYLAGGDPARHIRRMEAGDREVTGPIVRALECIAKEARVKCPWQKR
jgi:transcriptional regulator with XRE-family HTH domain